MYTKGFFIKEPVGNNAFSYAMRKNKKIWVPSIKIITHLEEISLQQDRERVAFEDFDFQGKLSTNYGLKNFYKFFFQDKEIILFDNHNHALYFWYEARKKGVISDNCTLIHIDEHADTRDNQIHISDEETQDLKKIFHITNYVVNVGDYIIPAQKQGLIQDIIQIRNTQNLHEYILKYMQKSYQKGTLIVNLDLDFFQPDLDFIDYDIKKRVIWDAVQKADIITVATSPFFIDQKLAIKVFKDIFSPFL